MKHLLVLFGIFCLVQQLTELSPFAFADEVYRYRVTGVVKKLPSNESKADISIRHDPIPDYVDETGKKVGMNTMTMPFTLSDPSLAHSLGIGDRIEFLLESRWKPKPSDLITELRKID